MPKKPMTDQEAVALAFKRWGKDGRAWHPGFAVKGSDSYCLLGETNGHLHKHQWAIYGTGPTWEEAFRDADERMKT